jgi:hypothetical protein
MRWFLDREDSPWYSTARLFRQPTRGASSPAIARVAGELQHHHGGRRGSTGQHVNA